MGSVDCLKDIATSLDLFFKGVSAEILFYVFCAHLLLCRYSLTVARYNTTIGCFQLSDCGLLRAYKVQFLERDMLDIALRMKFKTVVYEFLSNMQVCSFRRRYPSTWIRVTCLSLEA